MAWYKESMATVWGQMASGIMFRHNGNILLQSRSSDVEDGGTWGIPGGALKGTEGYYDSKDLPEPQIDKDKLMELFGSALQEVEEETGNSIELSYNQIEAAINSHVQYRKDNFVYVTFVVDVTDEQALIFNDDEHNWESDGHNWFHKNDLPENVHPGVSHVLNKLDERVDITDASFADPIKIAYSYWTQGQSFIEDGVYYDVEKLKTITKDNKVSEINVDRLTDQLFDKNVWKYGDRKLSPMMVLNDPLFDHVVIQHMSRIRTSDLDKPIFIRSSDNKIIDGYHRLTRAFLQKEKKIKAIIVQEEQMGQAVIDTEKDDDQKNCSAKIGRRYYRIGDERGVAKIVDSIEDVDGKEVVGYHSSVEKNVSNTRRIPLNIFERLYKEIPGNY